MNIAAEFWTGASCKCPQSFVLYRGDVEAKTRIGNWDDGSRLTVCLV